MYDFALVIVHLGSEVERVVEQLFPIYDLDGSNDLNAAPEVEMLAMNTAVKLELVIDEELLKHKVAALGELDESNGLTADRFVDWFLMEFPS